MLITSNKALYLWYLRKKYASMSFVFHFKIFYLLGRNGYVLTTLCKLSFPPIYKERQRDKQLTELMIVKNTTMRLQAEDKY
jgi:hypothetical protein